MYGFLQPISYFMRFTLYSNNRKGKVTMNEKNHYCEHCGVVISTIEGIEIDNYKNDEGKILCSNCGFIDAIGQLRQRIEIIHITN